MRKQHEAMRVQRGPVPRTGVSWDGEGCKQKEGEARLENCKWQFKLDFVNTGEEGFEQF